MNPITILPHGKKLQVAYKLRLLDLALIRSNGPDEVMTRTIKNNSGVIEDRFVIPSSKIRHAMREAVEIVQRTFDIAVTCRAQNYCSACPACWMFGTLGSTGENRKNWSMTSHLEMAEAISLTGGPLSKCGPRTPLIPRPCKPTKPSLGILPSRPELSSMGRLR